MNGNDALNWLRKAQDLGVDQGISAYYDARYRLWMPSYPEVTGYVIPTFLRYGEIDRALAASRWLRRVQLSNGSMPSGPFNSYNPFEFDTGMALRGWNEIQRVYPEKRTEESMEKALAWIKERWLEDPDHFKPIHNVRTLWTLKELNFPYVQEMSDYFESFLLPNGFPVEAETEWEPLSHFIVYVARGFFEIGRVDLASKIMENLPSIPNSRYDKEWRPTDDTVCVPGVAQAAILNYKLGNKQKAYIARNYLETLTAPWASDPIEANYLPNSQVSWAAKFIADAFYLIP